MTAALLMKRNARRNRPYTTCSGTLRLWTKVVANGDRNRLGGGRHLLGAPHRRPTFPGADTLVPDAYASPWIHVSGRHIAERDG